MLLVKVVKIVGGEYVPARPRPALDVYVRHCRGCLPDERGVDHQYHSRQSMNTMGAKALHIIGMLSGRII